MKKPLIEVKNLSYSYNENYSKNNLILENISFKIYKKDLVAIIGHNGQGKSTLIKLLLNLLKTKKGEISISKKLSYIPQNYNQDVNFPAKVCEILNLECCDCKLRKQILKKLRISNLLEKQFKSLSGGQKQKVLLSLSLLSNPEILILDEPTIGIDKKTQKNFYELLKNLNEERELTILFITHDIDLVSKYFTKIIQVENKKIYIKESKKGGKNV